MTDILAFDGAPGAFVAAPTETRAEADRASRRWRQVWRLHFYAGILSAPVIVLLALSGLVILYTQPINDLLDSDVRTVTAQGDPLDYDTQAAAVRDAFPDLAITSVVTPIDDGHSTAFGLSDGRDAFVDPYTAEVLGTRDPDGGIVGLANRLHGTFNNDSLVVPFPTAAGVFGPDPAFTDLAVGDLLIEIFACWALVLAVSGVYLWLPRKEGTGRALFVPRFAARGRARWRDLHAIPGVTLSAVLVFIVASGLPWAAFWGSTVSWAAEELTPGTDEAQPGSTVAELGDLDRFGNRINWVLEGSDVPASDSPFGDHRGHHGGGAASGPAVQTDDDLPAPLSLDSVIRAGREDGLMPGFAVALPEDVVADDGGTVFGSYAASNPWPARSQDARSLYLDQFTGETIGSQYLYGYGDLQKAVDYSVSTHMGTQFGLANRIVMTGASVAAVWMVISGFAMYTRRRRPGSAGLPRRPRDVRIATRLLVIAGVLAVVFPLWGLSLLAVLAFDRFVIRRIGAMRRLFGQRA